MEDGLHRFDSQASASCELERHMVQSFNGKDHAGAAATLHSEDWRVSMIVVRPATRTFVCT
jgi:hypothetical protein